jgi:hypothetical protein
VLPARLLEAVGRNLSSGGVGFVNDSNSRLVRVASRNPRISMSAQEDAKGLPELIEASVHPTISFGGSDSNHASRSTVASV